MTEELKQKAKDFIDRIGKESGGNWLDKYYLTDLLVMFVTEETKELQEENKQLKKLVEDSRKDGISPINALIIKNLDSQVMQAKEIIKTFCGLYSVFNSSNGSFDNLIKKAQAFLNKE